MSSRRWTISTNCLEAPAASASAYASSREHLEDELRRLDLLLSAEVCRRRSGQAAAPAERFHGLFISDDEVDRILAKAGPDGDAVSPIPDGLLGLEQRIAEGLAASEQQGIRLAAPDLARLFGLSPFDLDVVLACAAPELDSRYSRLYGFLQDDLTRRFPTIDLVLALFCRTATERLRARQRFAPGCGLARVLSAHEPRTDHAGTSLVRPLRLDPAILNRLLDIDALDERFTGRASLTRPTLALEDLASSAVKRATLATLAADLRRRAGDPAGAPRLLALTGPKGTGKSAVVEALCTAAGLNLLVIDASLGPPPDTTWHAYADLICRQARLSGAAVYFDRGDALVSQPDQSAALNQIVSALDQVPAVFLEIPTLASADDRRAREWTAVEFERPDVAERRRIWRLLADRQGHVVESERVLDAAAETFALGPAQIRSALERAAANASERTPGAPTIGARDLHEACRASSSITPGALGRRVRPMYGWSDIVLGGDGVGHLREICAHVRHRRRVFEEWRFDEKYSHGRGLSALFTGPPGTGKTMAAEIIAGDLGLDLYKVDLASLVSKYIGETEKNLARAFDDAEAGNAILFFDEADALFGKRSEVQDAHDRYANLEVSYLLQKMEDYRGTVILASNLRKNIDEAFTRRVRFIVEFPLPDRESRLRIWRGAFPRSTPIAADVDLPFLASKMKLTGGHIRNIALASAFLAAGDGGVVQMAHVIRAVRREFLKMGRICTRSEFERYFALVEERS